MDSNLNRTWHLILDGLYEGTKDNIIEDLSCGDSYYCEIDSIRWRLAYIENLNRLSESFEDYERGSLNYEDLKSFTKFLKEDVDNDKEYFKKMITDLLEYVEVDNKEENIDSIVSFVFS